MPFIQMENISHFLRACESPPLNMPAHDRFLTVDLYESKDPAQVIQCLVAFSRVANAVNPAKFPTTVGPRRGGATSPTRSTASNGFGAGRERRGREVSNTSQSTTSTTSSAPKSTIGPLSPALTGGSNASRTTDTGTKSPAGPVSSWSKRSDEGVTAPAWNIHQYGYMGGASQGNQGVAFGARRQITTAAPHVPSFAEKERKRKEKEAEDERLRLLAEEAEHKRRVEREAEEERLRVAEEQRREDEARRKQEEEKRRIAEQKSQWEEQERRWKEDEERRLREEKEAHEHFQLEAQRGPAVSDGRLRGQYLSQYQAEQVSHTNTGTERADPVREAESDRVKELERQLAEAKERERQYQLEREERTRHEQNDKSSQRKARSRSRSRPPPAPRAPSPKESEVSWVGDEREYLRQQWATHQPAPRLTPQKAAVSPRPLPDPNAAAVPVSRPLPEPERTPIATPSPRPLPDPSSYRSLPGSNPGSNRTDRFLSSNPAPVTAKPAPHYPSEIGLTSTSERSAEDARRMASQQKAKAGGWASKSLLEREMERERERQREWEEAQKRTKDAARDTQQGTGEGQSWDVNQYGWVGGDSQNRPGAGIGFGGRRQIIGPRPGP